MSCIRFNTPAQRRQMREHAPTQLSPEEAAALHPAPAVTESKLNRLRILAGNPDPKIRSSVASNGHAPSEVLEALAHDSDDEVRAWVARNDSVPDDILRGLARDPADTVRAFVAVNFRTPRDVLDELVDDASETVRGLVQWKSSLAIADLSPRPQ